MHTSDRPRPRGEMRTPLDLTDLPPDAQHLLRTLARIAKRQAAQVRPQQAA